MITENELPSLVNHLIIIKQHSFMLGKTMGMIILAEIYIYLSTLFFGALCCSSFRSLCITLSLSSSLFISLFLTPPFSLSVSDSLASSYHLFLQHVIPYNKCCLHFFMTSLFRYVQCQKDSFIMCKFNILSVILFVLTTMRFGLLQMFWGWGWQQWF